MTALFPPEFFITYDAQDFRPLGMRDHVKRDGSTTRLIDWRTDCPSCGAVFIISTGLNFKSPTRRCTDCKAPGQTVKRIRRSQAGREANRRFNVITGGA